MAVFKCKMCGGALEIGENQSVATCEYCGTKQTLPKLDNEQKVNLYDRANHFRRNNDYDKAMAIYENILNTDTTDAEAYWSILLCRYGVEYVEDPATHMKVPTINRAQFTSVFADEDYKSAIEYASPEQKAIYEQEAAYIDEVQKGILEISNKEEPFDVFICYKETDSNGRRTRDSVLATELYHGLINEGFKVFFSRITLEDKLGQEYEPYIFAALNSAKVMVVIGTRPEHFNAVWVKNEWSRYLSLVKKSNGQKILIPAYKDMDPYDLPEEFSHLQAQDMSKLGFMQDLIRGIKKIAAPKETVKETVILNNDNSDVAPLLERGFIVLEDKDWSKADELFETVLNKDPKNAQAYLGGLLVELKVSRFEDLSEFHTTFSSNKNYEKIMRFADNDLKEGVKKCNDIIARRMEEERKKDLYENALEIMESATTEEMFENAGYMFIEVKDYADAKQKSQECFEKGEIARKDTILAEAEKNMTGNDASTYQAAIKLLEEISGWKDADEKILACRKKFEEIKAKEETERIERERRAEEERIEHERAEAEKIIQDKVNTKKRIIIVVIAILLSISIIIVSIVGDSKKQVDLFISKYGESAYEKIGLAEVGEYIVFGEYEQDNNISNGKEPIEWLVLDVSEDKALVISKYALDCQPFDKNKNVNTCWETSTLRKWLNDEFFNAAFLEEEQQVIPTMLLSDDYTSDKVFILSYDEINKYLSGNRTQCKLTTYAQSNGANGKSDGSCWWPVRSLDEDGYGDSVWYAYVDIFQGGVNYHNFDKNRKDRAVRPAIWIDLTLL